MCGIAGHVALGQGATLDAGVLGTLRHRGPDAQRLQRCSLENCSWELAFARLAIQDLSAHGEQPMTNEDGSLVMVFNGEIYNSPELRRRCENAGHHFKSTMDGEVILHLWEIEGPACLERLNGIFAIAVASTVTGEVWISRDPVGVKPLFYLLDDRRGLWFASELTALAAAGAPIGGHDTVALAQFLSFLWIPAPRTPYHNVSCLEPGQVLHWSPHATRLFRYCPRLVPAINGAPMDFEPAVEEGWAAVKEAVRRQLLSDVPIGLMASGGVDSSLIWAAAPHAFGAAFTVTWPGDTGREGIGEDEEAVRTLERRFGTPVQYIPGTTSEDAPPQSGDLVADPAQGLAELVAMHASARGYKVLLCGQGGDELFAGYRRHRVTAALSIPRLGKGANIAAKLLGAVGPDRLGLEYAARSLRTLAEPDAFHGYMQLCTYSTSEERARTLNCTEREVENDVVWQEHRKAFDRCPPQLSLLRKMLAVDVAVYLPGLGLAYMDRSSMQHGVEVRVPWLDLELIRWSLTLPDDLLLRWRGGKVIPKGMAEQHLSPHLAHRAKRGFGTPIERLKAENPSGQSGFRQGSYFTRAAGILQTFLAAPDTAGPQPSVVGAHRP